MTTPYKLHIKVGQAEFLAEGSEATVNEQYQKFLELLSATGPHKVGQQVPPRNRPEDERDQGNATEPTQPPRTPTHDELGLVFTEDQNGVISLRRLPQTESRSADAVFLILYGFRAVKGDRDVPAGTLLAALKQSGISLNRLDRLLVQYRTMIHRGGTRKGSRYGLTNPGVAHAERLMNQLTE